MAHSGFRGSGRLRKRRDFLAVQSAARRSTPGTFWSWSRKATAPGGVGITVTKKIGNAVTRNRVKRLVRECVRQSRPMAPWVPAGRDVVIVAKRVGGARRVRPSWRAISRRQPRRRWPRAEAARAGAGALLPAVPVAAQADADLPLPADLLRVRDRGGREARAWCVGLVMAAVAAPALQSAVPRRLRSGRAGAADRDEGAA